jgi:hypothetical protein
MATEGGRESLFEEVSEKVVAALAPIEQISPVRPGQIQKLISDADEGWGRSLAPAFATAQIFFLLAFVGYFVVALVALVLDAQAMDDSCAEETWIWLYVLLVLVLPTTLGFVVGLMQAAMYLAFQDPAARKVVDMVLAIPSPLIMVLLGIIGLALIGGMADECEEFYWQNFALLVVVFYIQVVLMCLSAVFGLLTLCAMGIGLMNSATRHYWNIEAAGKDELPETKYV